MSDPLIPIIAEEGPIEADLVDARNGGAIDFLEDFAGVPEPDAQPVEAEPTMATRIVRDVGLGIAEAPGQVVGGILDAYEGALSGVASFDQWASEKLGLPKLQLFDRDGNLDIRLMSAEDAGEADVMLPEVGEPDTVTGGLVRGVSQFLAGFAVGAKAIGGLKGATATATGFRGTGAAAVSDFAAFDGHEQRLSDLIQSVPALQNPVTEYLASDMEDSELEGRLKNVMEGALSDAAIAGLVTAVRSIRQARTVLEFTGAGSYREAAEQLAREPELGRFAAPDVGALRGSDLPPISRVGQDADPAEIAEYLGRWPQSVSDAVEKSPDAIEGMLDALRSGPAPSAGRRRPVAAIVKGMGGIDPAGPLAAELRARGITPQTFPGMFKRGGLSDLDNIPVAEQPIFRAAGVDDGQGYVPQQAWIDALEDEAAGNPWRSFEEGEFIASNVDPINDLSEELDRMGIDYMNMSNEEVLRALDDQARMAADLEGLDAIGDSAPRSGDEFAAEMDAMAAASPLAGSRIETGQGDVFVNWSRLNTAEDVKGVIQDMADMAADEIEAARRGVRTNEMTELSADQLSAWDILAERRTGQPLNAEETLAMRRLWVSSGEKVVEAARAVREAPTEANVFAFRRAMALHGTVQREVLAVRTETARALQQWAIPAGSDAEMARHINDVVDMFGGSETSSKLADAIIAAADNGNLSAIDNMSRKGALASTLDAVFEYWRGSILSGPKTHIVNMASNAGVVGLLQMERLAAAGIGALRGGRDALSAREAGAMFYGAISSVKDAWRFARQSFVTNQSGYGMGKIEAPYTRAISTEVMGDTKNQAFNAVANTPIISHAINALGLITSVPGRSLGAADEFFKTINFRMEVHAQAVRQAMQEARDGLISEAEIAGRAALIASDPPENIRIIAREAAQYGTFTNDPGQVVRQIGRLRNRIPFARYVMPFLNTPANILRFTAERTPVAPILPQFRADFMAGGVRRDMALARMGLGSAAMMTAFDMAMNGQITGSGPANYTERAALRRAGWQPYSVRFGDRYFAFNRLDPIGMQLGVAAELAEVALNSDTDPGGEFDEAVYRAIGAVAQNMVDKAYVRGLAEFFEIASDPSRYAPTYFERLASGFVPAALREVATAMEPEMTRASNTIERMMERIPILRDDVATRHDLWGRPISYQSGLGAGYDAISPIYSSRLDPEPIDLELQRIRYFPGSPSRTITVDGTGYSLKNEPAVYEEYMVLQGGTPASQLPVETKSNGDPTAQSARLISYGDATMLETLNAIVSGQHARSAEYMDEDDAGKERLLEGVIRDYRSAARAEIIARHPEIFGGSQ